MTASTRAPRKPDSPAVEDDPGPSLIAVDDAERIARGAHENAFAVLGVHAAEPGWVVRTLAPDADGAELIAADGAALALTKVHPAGLFARRLTTHPGAYRIAAWRGATRWDFDDPYRFGPRLGELDEHLISEGTHRRLWQVLGAHPCEHEGTAGTAFAVWAPEARRVAVVGDFNQWDGRRHAMGRRGATGVWEIFVPGLGSGTEYMYELLDRDGRLLPIKADPVAFGGAVRPATRSVVRDLGQHTWRDEAWMAARAERQRGDRPIAIYEVHAGSWQRRDDGSWLSYRQLAERLVPYVQEMGFTHIELLPVSEHPLDDSWGYQPVGLYAPTSRFGAASDMRALVEACHAAGIGLIMDWVPAHFPADAHGLGRFDGTALYEHADPREGFHQDWNTLIYNYGRREVANFLTANALYWFEEFHIDALRVDAVASMLYRDYSRREGEWIPNVHGGRENLEAIDFLRRLNTTAHAEQNSVLTIAEESTAWPGVSHPVSSGGLGFDFKWNMGWMHDTLEYMAQDPLHRAHHHGRMSFGLDYAFSENFVLPLSHDEVVHGKGSLLGRMPGNRNAQFANLRAYYAFMYAHPGKKLLFMGQEFGQEQEWDHKSALPWAALEDPLHRGVSNLVGDLNRLYASRPALHARDCRADGFEWVDGAAAQHSVYAWLRHAGEDTSPLLAVFNFSAVEHRGWRLGVPRPGAWRETLNTAAAGYGGAGGGNLGGVTATAVASHGQPYSLELSLPPLSALFLEHEPGS